MSVIETPRGLCGLAELTEIMDLLKGALEGTQPFADTRGMTILYIKPFVLTHEYSGVRLPLEAIEIKAVIDDEDVPVDDGLVKLKSYKQFDNLAIKLRQLGNDYGKQGKMMEYAILVLTGMFNEKPEDQPDFEFLLIGEGVVMDGSTLIKTWGYKDGKATPVNLEHVGKTIIEAFLYGLSETHPFYVEVKKQYE